MSSLLITEDDLVQMDLEVTAVSEDTHYLKLIHQYKVDLQEFITTINNVTEDKDLVRRYLINKLEEKWVKLLGFNRTLIQYDITELQTPKTDFVTSLSLKDALGYYKPGSSWLIPELFRTVGLYILAGEPKVGKTLLINSLIYSVALSGKFLGKPARTGNVLYIQLEESLDTIAERLFFAGFGNLMDEETSLLVNFVDDRVRIERQFDILSDLDWLITKIREYKPVLVVIDSLRMAQLKNNTSENSNEYGKAVYALQRVFNFTNTCGVVIHHMNKLGGRNAQKTSLIERVSGHTSITAGSDGIAGVKAIFDEETGEKSLMLETLPRQGVPVSIEYQLRTGEDGLFKLHKLSEETSALNPNTSKILRFLASNPDAFFSENQIANAINSPVVDTRFKQALKYLESSQIIVSKYKSKKFVYSLTSDSLWIVNPQSIKELVSPAVLDANSLMRCTTKRELRELVSTWDKSRQNEAKKALLQAEKDRINDLINSWEFTVGQLVRYKGSLLTVVAIEDKKPTLKSNKYYLEDLSDPVMEPDIEPIDFEEDLIEEIAIDVDAISFDEDLEVTDVEKDQDIIELEEDITESFDMEFEFDEDFLDMRSIA